MDIATFRTEFPEFTLALYPDAQVTFWSNLGELLVNECKWDTMKPFGVSLFTAHHLVIAKANLDASTSGSLPGQTSGPTASKAVGSVSISYDTNAGLEKDAGHWNLTSYGKQFIHLLRMFGAGAVQL
jgi:hypothetical protein